MHVYRANISTAATTPYHCRGFIPILPPPSPLIDLGEPVLLPTKSSAPISCCSISSSFFRRSAGVTVGNCGVLFLGCFSPNLSLYGYPSGLYYTAVGSTSLPVAPEAPLWPPYPTFSPDYPWPLDTPAP